MSATVEDDQIHILLPLKIKQPVILPANWVYWEMAVGLQFETCKLWQSLGKSREHRRGILLYREKGESWKSLL